MLLHGAAATRPPRGMTGRSRAVREQIHVAETIAGVAARSMTIRAGACPRQNGTFGPVTWEFRMHGGLPQLIRGLSRRQDGCRGRAWEWSRRPAVPAR